jgi:hypothetical protein
MTIVKRILSHSLVTLGRQQPNGNAIAGNAFNRDEMFHGLASPEAAQKIHSIWFHRSVLSSSHLLFRWCSQALLHFDNQSCGNLLR